jgi:hypothetical protein
MRRVNFCSFAILASIILIRPLPGVTAQENWGHFVGTVVTEWFDSKRKMKVVNMFAYVDPRGKQWSVPPQTVVDGASIPRIFWTAIGGPFEGPYRNASVVHDHYCVVRSETWQSVHRMFYEAMLAAGTPKAKAKAMFYAVYVGGPRWQDVLVTNHEPRAFPKPGDIDRTETRYWSVSFNESLARKHFQEIESSDLSLEQIENLANQAFDGTPPSAVIRIN